MDSDLTTDEKNSKISKTLEKDRHIWDFEDDEDEDKYEIFEKEIWSENIIPLVKEIQLNQKIIFGLYNKET